MFCISNTIQYYTKLILYFGYFIYFSHTVCILCYFPLSKLTLNTQKFVIVYLLIRISVSSWISSSGDSVSQRLARRIYHSPYQSLQRRQKARYNAYGAHWKGTVGGGSNWKLENRGTPMYYKFTRKLLAFALRITAAATRCTTASSFIYKPPRYTINASTWSSYKISTFTCLNYQLSA